MEKKFDLNDSSVVVIIGSGAGGGTLSNELAQKGIDVVCLEAGKRLDFADIVNNEAEMFEKMSWLDKRVGSGQMHPQLPAWICKTVGGTTMHWTAACPRLQEHEVTPQSTYGAVEDTSLIDWPISYEELLPYYDRAEDKMGVTGKHGLPMLPGNNNFKVMAAGAKKVGYKDIDTHNMAINSVERDDRPACQQLGFCTSGCAIGAKWSTLYTEIPQAEETGHFEIRPESMVSRIEHDKNGKVTGVEYFDKDGVKRLQKARIVCVAGNSIETPRLLLNSKSEIFPNGLANSSDQVGRNYMTHFTIQVMSIMPKPVNFHRGTMLAGIVRDEMANDPSRGFVGGYMINTVPFAPETLAIHMQLGKWGHEVTDALEQYKNIAGIMLIGEDLPQATNRITLHETEKDQHGLSVANVHYLEHENTRKMRRHAWDSAKKIHKAVGAVKSFEMGQSIPATHNLGTARMSENPKDGVCNKWGQTHDIDNLFISDGSVFTSSGCVNPSLTIVSLAIRQAEHISGLMQKNII